MHSFATDGGHVQQSRHRWQAPPALLPGEADLRKLLQLPEQYLTPEIHDAIYREVTRQELERRVSQESVFIGVRKRQRSIGMAWGATITIQEVPIVLGNKFQDEVVAARAHDMAALLLSPTRSTKRLNFAAWTYATELMKYKFEPHATILAELRLLQTQVFHYTTFSSRGTSQRKSVQSDIGPRPRAAQPKTNFGDSTDAYVPGASNFENEQWHARDGAQTQSTRHNFKVKQDALDTLRLRPSDLCYSRDSEAGDVLAALRRDSSQSGQSPMCSACSGRRSRISDMSFPSSRPTVSIEDRPAQVNHWGHVHSTVNNSAPRRAMVRDAADKGRQGKVSWRHFLMTGSAKRT